MLHTVNRNSTATNPQTPMKTSFSSYNLPVIDPITDAARSIRSAAVRSLQPAAGWCILITRHYYGAEDKLELARDARGDPAVYPTRAEAMGEIANRDGSRYYLSHNESGSPSYQLCRPGSRRYARGINCWGS